MTKRSHRKKGVPEVRSDSLFLDAVQKLTASMAIENPSWRDKAVCAGTTVSKWFSDFNPEHPLSTSDVSHRIETVRRADEAAVECWRCPVRADCLRYAIQCGEWHFGVFGGLTPFHRRRLARALGYHVSALPPLDDSDLCPVLAKKTTPSETSVALKSKHLVLLDS